EYGRCTHANTVRYEKSGKSVSSTAAQSPSTMSATAVSRCIHQCSAAPLAVPSPRTRFSGVTRLMAAPLDDGEPRERGRRERRDDDDRPAARADLLGLEARADVPGEMAHPVCEVQEEAERPADQRQLEPWRGEQGLHGRVALRPAREREQPDGQRD